MPEKWNGGSRASRSVISAPPMWALQVLICTLAISVFHISFEQKQPRGHFGAVSASALLGACQ